MKIAVLVSGLLHIASLAIATPIQESSLETRQAVDIYFVTVCEHSGFRGRCDRLQAAWHVCFNVIGENEDWASSARADAGGNCVFYGDRKCAGPQVGVSPVGVNDFATAGFDNQFSSYICGP